MEEYYILYFKMFYLVFYYGQVRETVCSTFLIIETNWETNGNERGGLIKPFSYSFLYQTLPWFSCTIENHLDISIISSDTLQFDKQILQFLHIY